jgi:hypothetical protein
LLAALHQACLCPALEQPRRVARVDAGGCSQLTRTKAPTRFGKQCLQYFESGLTAKNLDELGFVHELMLN